MRSLPWQSHSWSGRATDFHAADLPFERAVWLCRPSAPALILGSSQPDGDIDRPKALERGVEVSRRRSGGGAVFVHPDESIWIDIVIPRDDPLWVDDVGRSMLWVGHAWARALAPWVAPTTLAVHPGPFEVGDGGAAICFASASPGEVFTRIDHDDRSKVVGISQRRGREGARFQCIAYRAWEPNQWADLLTSPHAQKIARSVRVEFVSASVDEVVEGLSTALNSHRVGRAESNRAQGGAGEPQGDGGG